MPNYIVTIQKGRQIDKISIIAPDEASAAKQARRRQGRVLEIRKKSSFSLTTGMSASERHTFLMRMSTMLTSKTGTAGALRIIGTTFSGRIAKVAMRLLQQVEGGMQLIDAMAMDSKNFPLTTVALIRAGIQTGDSSKALFDAAAFEYEMEGMRRGASKGLLSAMGSFLVAAALLLSTVFYFGPQVTNSGLVQAAGDAIQTKWVDQLAYGLGIMMAVITGVFTFLVWLATVGKRIFPVVADKIILSIPYYKDLVLAQNTYITYYKLSLLIRSGVRLEEAFTLSASSAPRGALRKDLEAAAEAVRSGREWAKVMKTLHPTDKAALAVATNRDEAARTLDALAVQYKVLYKQRLEMVTPSLQLFAALCMSLAGGVLFGQTILPMLQMAAKFSQ